MGFILGFALGLFFSLSWAAFLVTKVDWVRNKFEELGLYGSVFLISFFCLIVINNVEMLSAFWFFILGLLFVINGFVGAIFILFCGIESKKDFKNKRFWRNFSLFVVFVYSMFTFGFNQINLDFIYENMIIVEKGEIKSIELVDKEYFSISEKYRSFVYRDEKNKLKGRENLTIESKDGEKFRISVSFEAQHGEDFFEKLIGKRYDEVKDVLALSNAFKKDKEIIIEMIKAKANNYTKKELHSKLFFSQLLMEVEKEWNEKFHYKIEIYG